MQKKEKEDRPRKKFCARCGRKVRKFIQFHGRIVCVTCYQRVRRQP